MVNCFKARSLNRGLLEVDRLLRAVGCSLMLVEFLRGGISESRPSFLRRKTGLEQPLVPQSAVASRRPKPP